MSKISLFVPARSAWAVAIALIYPNTIAIASQFTPLCKPDTAIDLRFTAFKKPNPAFHEANTAIASQFTLFHEADTAIASHSPTFEKPNTAFDEANTAIASYISCLCIKTIKPLSRNAQK